MNRIKVLAGGAAVLLLGMAQPANAQYSFYNVCTPGAMRACASAEVFMQGPDLVMRVWNMNGTGTKARKDLETYNSEFGGWHTITAVGLRGVQYSIAPGGANASVAFVNSTGNSRAMAAWGQDASANSLGILGTGADYGPGNMQGITGCWNPDRAKLKDNARTCNMHPDDAYVQFTFTGLTDIDMTNATFAFNSRDMGSRYGKKGTAEGGYELIGGTALEGPPAATVTPEPVTTILLGSGLAGIAAARRRKKKAKEDAAAAI